jgi:Protein of unknown function (DUF1499)
MSDPFPELPEAFMSSRDPHSPSGSAARGRALLRWGLVLAVLGMLLVALAGPAYRFSMLELRPAFSLLKWGAYAGLAGVALALVGIALGPRAGRDWGLAALALAAGFVAAAMPFGFQREAKRVPPIHDITTDVADPPAFVAVLPLRAAAPNPAEYGGPEIAAQQQAAYPDITSLVLLVPPAAAFATALAEARDMDWEIVAADSAAGRIEATATTRWFGFKDDVVVRIRPDARGGSRIDVRSVSRVGRSDVGKNAARIREYLEELREHGAGG